MGSVRSITPANSEFENGGPAVPSVNGNRPTSRREIVCVTMLVENRRLSKFTLGSYVRDNTAQVMASGNLYAGRLKSPRGFKRG